MDTATLYPYSPDIDAADVRHLPKSDIHVHAESKSRLMQVLEQRRGLTRYSNRSVVESLLQESMPGLERLLALDREVDRQADIRTDMALVELYEQPDYVEAFLEVLMDEEAADGAMLAEIRMGGGWPLFPHFLPCFRAAERRVQTRHPGFCAEPIIAWTLNMDVHTLELVARYTIELAPEGIAGIDLYPEYRFWDYPTIYRLAERAAEAGLGITCHEGEFEIETLRQALDIPGLRRLGHATQAFRSPGLMDEIAMRGIVVEVAPTSNVATGAVASLAEHPLRRFVDAGIAVTLCSDDPIMFDTTIGREYAVARAMGFSDEELLAFTRTGIEASFTSPQRKRALLHAFDAATLPA